MVRGKWENGEHGIYMYKVRGCLCVHGEGVTGHHENSEQPTTQPHIPHVYTPPIHLQSLPTHPHPPTHNLPSNHTKGCNHIELVSIRSKCKFHKVCCHAEVLQGDGGMMGHTLAKLTCVCITVCVCVRRWVGGYTGMCVWMCLHGERCVCALCCIYTKTYNDTIVHTHTSKPTHAAHLITPHPQHNTPSTQHTLNTTHLNTTHPQHNTPPTHTINTPE